MWFILVFVVVMVCATCLMVLDSVKPKKFPPGPVWLPIFGCYFNLKKLALRYHCNYQYEILEKLTSMFGRIVGLKIGKDKIIAVSGYDDVKKILTMEEFDARPDGFFFRLRSKGLRLGVVFVEGKFFQIQKKFCHTTLKKLGSEIRDLEEVMLSEASELVMNIRRKITEDSIIPVNALFDMSVLNILWMVMAGKRFELDDKKLTELIDMVHESFRLLDMSGGVLNQMPFLRYIFPRRTGYSRIKQVLDKFSIFLSQTINEHKWKEEQGRNNLIDYFLTEIKNKTDPTFTDLQLSTLLLDLFMAGSETTSNTLISSLLYMILYPHVQEKIHKEIDDHVPRGQLPCLLDRKRLSYVDAVLFEVLRHATIVPVSVAHRAVVDVDINDFVIPQNSIVLVSLRSVFMDRRHWGDPEVFRPERFLDVNGQLKMDDWFIPFGQGKRRCLGEMLAKSTMFILFSAVMQTFNISSEMEGLLPRSDFRDGVTLSPYPFKAKFTLRKP